MTVYLLFSPKEDEHICTYVFTSEKNKIISYSYDEEYIVKEDEPKIKSFSDLEEKYSDKGKNKKNKQAVLIKREYPDIKDALFYLDGTLEDFNQEIKARKKLPSIINPFDMDFEEDVEDFSTIGKAALDDDIDGNIEDSDFMKDFDADEEEDTDNYSDNYDEDDDDLYK